MGLARFALANAGQPQYEAQLDRSNPLVNRLRYAQLGSSLRDAVSGRFGVDSGGSTKAVGLKGGTREFVPASNQYVNLGTKDICSGYPLTVASWIRWDAVSVPGFVAYSLNDTNCSAIFGSAGGSGWAANTSSATGFQQKGTPVTGLNHFVTIHRNGTWDIYINGVIQPNGAKTAAWGPPAAGNHSIGGRLGGSSLRPMDGQVQDLQVYQGELTPTEIQSLYLNHWQIWQAPGPSLIFPLPSGGGAAVSTAISATTANSIGGIASNATSRTVVAATTSDAVGGIVSHATCVSVLAATTENTSASVVSKVVPRTDIAATTGSAVGAIYSFSTCKTAVTASTADSVGSIASSSVGACATGIGASTANDTAAISTYSTSKLSVGASTAGATAAINGYSTSKSSIDATLASVFGTISSSSISTPFTPEQIVYLEANYVSIANINDIAVAVLAAMNAAPPPVNIKQVNGVTVDGTGVLGDEWGPL